MSEDNNKTSRQNILDLIDNFVEQVHKLQKILLGVSISAIILAPLAIGLSVYLILHPSFFGMLDKHDDFGFALLILLGAVISISSIWFVTGLRQYRPVKFMNEKYKQYQQEKDEIDKKIASQYGLDKE